MLASISGRTEIVKTLLAAGANVNLKYKNEKTALSVAQEKQHQAIVQMPRQAGAK